MYVKHPILLPQVKHTDYFGLKKERKRKGLLAQHSVKFNRIPSCTNIENLVFLWAVVKVLKGVCEVLQESGTKHILVNTKLMP